MNVLGCLISYCLCIYFTSFAKIFPYIRHKFFIEEISIHDEPFTEKVEKVNKRYYSHKINIIKHVINYWVLEILCSKGDNDERKKHNYYVYNSVYVQIHVYRFFITITRINFVKLIIYNIELLTPHHSFLKFMTMQTFTYNKM